LFPAQRITALKQIVREKKTVDIATLCKAIGVSDVTVRKYLDQLESEGFLKKLHGGAMLVDDDFSLDIPAEDGLSARDAEQIAALAASLIEDGDSIFIGQGRLCLELSKKLSGISNLTVITNNISAVPDIVASVRKLFFIGGEIISQNGSIYSFGTNAINQLKDIYVQKAFIGVDGVDMSVGVTVNDFELFEIINRIVEISRDIIILAEHSKFNKIGLHKISDIDRFKTYVSDKKLDERYKQYLFDKDIKTLTSYDI
jgi:DeoR/GlpR family transcriptional regulator of sugar metabolism